MSHLQHHHVPAEYTAYLGRKIVFLAGLALLAAALLVLAISLGPVRLPTGEIIRSLAGLEVDPRLQIIIHNIRLPHALAALLAGAGLAVAGAVMQSILRNPLGSPFTLGLSQAGAFGAALAVLLLGNIPLPGLQAGAMAARAPWLTTLFAFLACLTASLVIIAIARLRGASPEVMVLSGVALGSLFSAGTMFLQYVADDVQLAAMVFWSFGDVGRAGWQEVALMALALVASGFFFLHNRWNYNAIDAGDETARSLGVRVARVRLTGMIAASGLTAVIVSFLGVIGFVGLVCPHIVRRLIGDDHRFLLPASCLTGGILLLAADTVARLILAPHVLPVAVLTAFLGAPAFLYLLVQGRRR